MALALVYVYVAGNRGRTYRIKLRIFLEVLGPRNVDKDVGKRLDSVSVPPHHHVAEPDVIISIPQQGLVNHALRCWK